VGRKRAAIGKKKEKKEEPADLLREERKERKNNVRGGKEKPGGMDASRKKEKWGRELTGGSTLQKNEKKGREKEKDVSPFHGRRLIPEGLRGEGKTRCERRGEKTVSSVRGEEEAQRHKEDTTAGRNRQPLLRAKKKKLAAGKKPL